MLADSLEIPCFVPSRLDGRALEALVTLSASDSASGSERAVVFVHPYPPLGGQFRNNVIHELRARLDGRVAVSVAFNLRGAGRSEGKTSWTGCAEHEDLCSVLDMLRTRHLPLHPAHHSASDRRLLLLRMQARGFLPPAADVDHLDSLPLPPVSLTLVCGYSYGAVVAASVCPADCAPLRVDYALISFPYSVLWLLVLQRRSWLLARITSTVVDAAVAFATAAPQPAHIPRTLFVSGTADTFTSLSAYNKWWDQLHAKAILALQAVRPPIASDAATHAAAKALTITRIQHADHAWLRRECELSDVVECWWWQ
ncbi:hypothetical protein GGI25_004606 [Coemansia spiralis]|uniref:Alpha/beta hydrolase n=2 Tax=Coemansia TaxID=4863 RepID=A0A9W8G4G2_9FUNG|nr:hypothetical protein EDC05_004530 [Coemansia umbellata]KAJ2620450.1 hypothetical protein GGI26_005020 [Coemansia sp. RSA 1358]KAJ2673621.1 hypothetical protein GGI25_004606 [Coemansia spiralis]